MLSPPKPLEKIQPNWCMSYSHKWGVHKSKTKFGSVPWCVFIQIKDITHIKRDFCSDFWVMPQGVGLGVLGGQNLNLSVGICDGAPLTAHSSLGCYDMVLFALMLYIPVNNFRMISCFSGLNSYQAADKVLATLQSQSKA